VRADSVAKEKDAPCDDYWSASVAINRIFAELHGYHFYLWHDTHNAVRSSGCVEGDAWLRTALPDLLNPDPKKLHPAWQKMLPIYCHLKQHNMALWIDSDAYVADVYQPIEFLLHATRFIEGGPRYHTHSTSETNTISVCGFFSEERADVPGPSEAGRVQGMQ
jgi:hypothetical protein